MGNSAFLLNEESSSKIYILNVLNFEIDVFKISVGNLPANATSSFEVKIICNFKQEETNSLRLTLPTFFVPRYDINPATGIINEDSSIKFYFKLEFNSNYKINTIKTTDSTASISIQNFLVLNHVYNN